MEYLIRQLLGLFRRPKFRFGPALNEARQRRLRTQNAQFLGYLEGSGFQRFHPDRHTKALHRRRLVGQGVALLIVLGIVWVMIESAHALALF